MFSAFPSKEVSSRVPELVRPLSEADAVLISSGQTPPTKKLSPIMEIRDRHHRVAKLVAQGVPNVEICAIVGVSPTRLQIYKGDPAFQELVAHYSEITKALYIDTATRLSDLAATAVTVLQERLEDDPAQFSNKDLTNLAMAAADRSGNGPSSTVKVQTTDVAKVIEALKKSDVIEGTSRVISREDENTQPTNSGENPESGMDESAELRREKDVPRIEGQGPSV